jgi:hypothetical protein
MTTGIRPRILWTQDSNSVVSFVALRSHQQTQGQVNA